MALNVGNLVATLGMDKKGFDTGIEGAEKATKGFAEGFAAQLSKLKVPIAVAGAAAATVGTAAGTSPRSSGRTSSGSCTGRRRRSRGAIGANQHTVQMANNLPSASTAERIAEQFNVSDRANTPSHHAISR